MIEYVAPGNIDDRVLLKSVKLLEGGGIAALPTDTSWSIVCSIQSRDGIKKLKSISGERDERFFTLLCSSIAQFGDWCNLDNTRFRIIKRLTPGPYVFILKTLLGTEKTLSLKRSEIGVKLPDHPVPVALIKALGCPLYGITAKRTMTNSFDADDYDSDTDNEANALYKEDVLFEGGWELEDINGLDLILDPGHDRDRVFSTVLDLRTGEVILLRQGIGQWPV